jgi:hypothetical protein
MSRQPTVKEQFLPKWYPSAERKSKVAQNVVALTLLILLTIFTLGIFSGIQHTSDTLKGRD